MFPARATPESHSLLSRCAREQIQSKRRRFPTTPVQLLSASSARPPSLAMNCSRVLRMTNESGTPAVFFDRDGTLMEDVDYCGDPSDVRVFPGASEALGRLKDAGL